MGSMPNSSIHEWVILGLVITGALAADLGIFHRQAREVGVKEALLESAAWIGLALGFNAWIYWSRGQEAGLQFLASYLVEKSLSVDNIFIFVVIFGSLRVPARLQHRVLYYGVAGALLMRAIFVLGGVRLLAKFHAILFVFGAILLVTGLRMLWPGKQLVRPEQNWVVRLARSVVPIVDTYADDKLWVKQDAKWKATPLLVALLAVEALDIVFAVDSVPAVLAITRDPFLAFSSNAFAILGLRALYFALAGALPRIRFLHQGLAAILIFVSCKMFLGSLLQISTIFSLGIIAIILLFTVVASVVLPGRP